MLSLILLWCIGYAVSDVLDSSLPRCPERETRVAMRYIREHANGWIAEVEASAVADQWHVVAYHLDIGLDQIPAALDVRGDVRAKELADGLVQEHGPHQCGTGCLDWRLVDADDRPGSA
jgi:hypothetical protein